LHRLINEIDHSDALKNNTLRWREKGAKNGPFHLPLRVRGAEEDDPMTKLSPKAVRFVDAAVISSEGEQIRAVWSAFKRDPATDLPDEVARGVPGSCGSVPIS
jgi:hypothetical protein